MHIETIFGYHGTTAQNAEQILATGLVPSHNSHDWLGRGSYWWEDDPLRAADWAAESYEGEPVSVIEAEISKEFCWNLGTRAGLERLRPYYSEFLAIFGRDFVARLRQGSRARRMDCAVVNYACYREQERGRVIHVVRAPFKEGRPLWEDPLGELGPAGISDLDHVQLAVRDPEAILNMSVFELENM